MDLLLERWLEISIGIVVIYYYFKFTNKKKRRLAEEAYRANAGKCIKSLHNLFSLGACIDGKIDDLEMEESTKSITKLSNEPGMFNFPDDIDYDTEVDKRILDLIPKLLKANDEKNITSINEDLVNFVKTEIVNINNVFLDPEWIKDDDYNKELKINILFEFIWLIGADFDVNDSELHLYKLIKEGLEVSDEDADSMFSRMMKVNKDALLNNLEKIPTVTKKIAEYIGEEYTDLKTLSKETSEQLRERVPGLSKPAAVAIIRKLSWLSN